MCHELGRGNATSATHAGKRRETLPGKEGMETLLGKKNTTGSCEKLIVIKLYASIITSKTFDTLSNILFALDFINSNNSISLSNQKI